MPSSQILPIHRMADIKSQGDETDYGDERGMVETLDTQTINEQMVQKSQEHYSYRDKFAMKETLKK